MYSGGKSDKCTVKVVEPEWCRHFRIDGVSHLNDLYVKWDALYLCCVGVFAFERCFCCVWVIE